MTDSDTSADIYLASSSPRRKMLLKQIGVRFTVLSVAIEESRDTGETPLDFVQRMAREKAQAGWELPKTVSHERSKPVLGADTIVLHQGVVMGKPHDRIAAKKMLLSLSESMHQVITAVCIVDGEQCQEAYCCTDVKFRSISEIEAERYWDTGEPKDKAGGYGIQGLGAVFVNNIDGSYSSVVGLPIAETMVLLGKFSIPWWQSPTLKG